MTVAIKVADRAAFGDKLGGQGLFLERDFISRGGSEGNWPPSIPGGALLFLDGARSGASSGPASGGSIASVRPPSARSPGVGSTLRPDGAPGKGWLSPAMGETFQSR